MTSNQPIQQESNSLDSINWVWSPVEVVSTESSSTSCFSALTSDNTGNVFITWDEQSHISFKQRNSNSTWSSTEQFTTNKSTISSVAVDPEGNIHVAFVDPGLTGIFEEYQIYYQRREQSTGTWTTAKFISEGSNHISAYPSICADLSGNVHIVWQDQADLNGSGLGDANIFYRKWDKDLSSWSSIQYISTESTSHASIPDLAVDYMGNVHVCWQDLSDYLSCGVDSDIFYKRWDVSLNSWTNTSVVSTESSAESSFSSIDVDPVGTVHIAWQEQDNYLGSGNDYDICYKRRDSNSWSTATVVSTESTANSVRPEIAIDLVGNAHIVWTDWTNYANAGNDADIWYKRWDSTFSAWTYSEIISTDGVNDSKIPSIDVNEYGVYVAWEDAVDIAGAGGDYDILFKVLMGPPKAPIIATLYPTIIDFDAVQLEWNKVCTATEYFIYRAESFIWSIDELTPLDVTPNNHYIDILPEENTYFYVIVAANYAGKSPISNCVNIEYKIPHLREFVLITSLLGVGLIISVVVILKRRKG